MVLCRKFPNVPNSPIPGATPEFGELGHHNRPKTHLIVQKRNAMSQNGTHNVGLIAPKKKLGKVDILLFFA